MTFRHLIPLYFSLAASALGARAIPVACELENPDAVKACAQKVKDDGAKLDGVVSPGEYGDASTFRGVAGWTPQFSPTQDPNDLSLTG